MTCSTEYVYKTKWKGHPHWTWAKECNFVRGFTISDYWKGLAKKAGKVRGHSAGKRGVVVSDDGGEVQYKVYRVEKIKAHVEKEESVMFLVKWKGYKTETWEEEENFDEEEDLLLAQYWKKVYNEKN
jgi:hypothetical protein